MATKRESVKNTINQIVILRAYLKDKNYSEEILKMRLELKELNENYINHFRDFEGRETLDKDVTSSQLGLKTTSI